MNSHQFTAFDGKHVQITYFVKSGDSVKIGKTSSISDRINGLQTGSAHPIELLKLTTVPELAVHAVAETITDRLSGEWFQMSDQLIEFMKGLPDADLTAPIYTEEELAKHESFSQGLKNFVTGNPSAEKADRCQTFMAMSRLMEGLIDRGVAPSCAWEVIKSVFDNCFGESPTLTNSEE